MLLHSIDGSGNGSGSGNGNGSGASLSLRVWRAGERPPCGSEDDAGQQGDADGDVDGAWAVSRGWDAPGPHGGLIDVEG